jgi:hypothetical protein
VWADDWPKDVEAALVEAGTNRPELERVLCHYRDGTDPQKFEAACFLIRNMAGHAYARAELCDAHGRVVPFDALCYPNLGAASLALKALEKTHGPLDFKSRRVDRDLQTLSADYLIEDIDLAFRGWREKPWARGMSFRTFCEYVLPYRANKEPVERWRRACEIDTRTIVAEMKDPADPREAAAIIQKHTKYRMGFNDLYYLHPTDQGFREMSDKPVGRCGDMSNMQVYVYRANCIAVAGDYTPYWANRDNNHGWEVVLDKDGRGSAGLFNRAAKVYRKMFSHNPANLVFQVPNSEPLPPWLGLRSYLDVTDQYLPTSDVTVSVEYPPPGPARVAYICVFNAGEWRPIHWAWVRDGHATFTNMGPDIAYLVGFYHDRKVVPAAAPFILDDHGKVTRLGADPGQAERIRLSAVKPAIKDDDLKKELPGKAVETGKRYELFLWDRGWKPLARQATAQPNGGLLQKLPAGGLFWLVSDDDRETARIFTVEHGRQRFW